MRYGMDTVQHCILEFILVETKGRAPALRRNDLADSILLRLGAYKVDVRQGIL
jgi:hypothetical protein